MKTNPKSNSIALTLVEILIVIAIFGILAALLFPVFDRVSKRAADAACLNNLRILGSGMFAATGDNNGRFPNITSGSGSAGRQWDAQIAPYLGIDLGQNVNIRTPFVCPAGKIYSGNPSIRLSRNLSYGYNTRVGSDAGGSGRLATIQEPSKLILIADRELTEGTNENYVTLAGGNGAIFISDTASRFAVLPYDRHGGSINILFADGHAAPRQRLGRQVGSFPENAPRGVRYRNDGPLSPQE
jgi:prepilin-type processing-associated H-X9-DG protein/prepilin-type N-terminal cleavage/methylation domain-containing protein